MYPIKKINIHLFTLFAISACFSCSCKQHQALFGSRKTYDSRETDHSYPSGNLIRPQHLLQIRNLQNRKYIVDEPMTNIPISGHNANGQTYLVAEDGSITLPIIGKVKVAGLSAEYAANQIEMLYRKELKDPIIELKIVNLKVTLLGEIKMQGTYPLIKEQTTLVEVIGEAGGLTEKANSRKIKIIRRNGQVPQLIEMNLSDIETLKDPRIILQNNDIIYVAQNKRTIRAEKLQSISAIFQPITALLSTALIIYTLSR